MSNPLDDVLIADFTQLVQGPYATQILADLGAEVIKVEPPGGDWLRRFALGNVHPGGISVSFLSFNRSKRSVALDLKSEDGQRVARELCRRADVVVENFRPGVMQRLGLDYETLRVDNPGLVYCSSSGYGSDGPYVGRPGQDLLIQAVTGLPLLNGRDGDEPVPVAIGIADLTAGLHIVYGVLAALLERTRTGEGQLVEVSLLNSLLAMQQQELTTYLATGDVPPRSTTRAGCPWIGAPFGIYATSDGNIAIAMTSASKLTSALGIPGWEHEDDQNLMGSDGDALAEAVQERLATLTTKAALDRLLAADVWTAPVQDYSAVVKDPQVRHNEMILDVPHPDRTTSYQTVAAPVRTGGRQGRAPSAPPLLGEHTKQVLADLGIDQFADARLGGDHTPEGRGE